MVIYKQPQKSARQEARLGGYPWKQEELDWFEQE